MCVGILALAIYADSVNVPEKWTARFHPEKTHTEDRVRVLIVPGHEPDSEGAVYLDRKERDLVVVIAKKLADLLSEDERVEVLVVRNENDFNQPLREYFDTHADEIRAWQSDMKESYKSIVEKGIIEDVKEIEHNNASADASLHLHGINKWSNENNVDLVVHLHVNDDVRKNRKKPGKYSGFSLYVPEKQFDNAEESMRLAEHMKVALSENFGTSTLKVEEKTIIESQDLIAVGKYNSLKVPATLIEYGYIYEPMFEKEIFERETAALMAEKTYRAIETYLFP